MLVPAGNTQGTFPVSLGLVKALNDHGTKAVLFKPFACCSKTACSTSTCAGAAFEQIASGNKSDVLQTIVENYNKLLDESKAEIVVVEGISEARFDKDELNADICHALDADIITIINGLCKKSKAFIDNTLLNFGNAGKTRVLGTVLLNRDAPRDAHGHRKLVLSGCSKCCSGASCSCEAKEPCVTNVIAKIAYNKDCYAPRAGEIAKFLDATISGDENKRNYMVTLNAANAKDGMLLVTDTEVESTEASTVVICGGASLSLEGKTVISTDKSAWAVAEALSAMPAFLAFDDTERVELCAAHGASAFQESFLKELANYDKDRLPLMSPAAFRYKLTALARAAHKRIALPEGDEPRTVAAAAKVAADNIAVPVLFGNKDKILSVAKEQGVTLGEGVEFVDPEAIRNNYVDRLVELRKKKGMTPEQALEMLQDNVALATMMIERGEVDGLVSGAVHTTANTIRPPLQIIKTAEGAKLVSAIFFMLMPEQVYIYGDCALNINPTAEEISEIAIQSADTAKAFGIDPKVAMVTYSTMNSGKGADVDLMREATELVHQKRPDIACDGPLQYDAAVMPDVAAQKAPNSPVAGKATVFIFPSLSTGNTVYKAVQRSADLVSIGPMLQGMRKPVNDLSRGALVDDIIYTIAVTAIQCTQAK